MNKGKDNLTICSIAANQAGMTYGKFMAMGGYARIEKRPEKSNCEGPTRFCRYCGTIFQQNHGAVRYCSDACRDAAKNKMNSERYYKKRRRENVKG